MDAPPPGREPHPLAERLIARTASGASVLDAGTGSGRNARALAASGFRVTAAADADAYALVLPRGPFDAVVATHALLHGTPAAVASLLTEIAATMRGGAMLYATFASVRDARFGEGERLGERTFAPADGDEAGVAHTYFDEAALRVLLAPYFTVEAMAEADADATAGGWAHVARPLRGAMHWMVEARRNDA